MHYSHNDLYFQAQFRGTNNMVLVMSVSGLDAKSMQQFRSTTVHKYRIYNDSSVESYLYWLTDTSTSFYKLLSFQACVGQINVLNKPILIGHQR